MLLLLLLNQAAVEQVACHVRPLKMENKNVSRSPLPVCFPQSVPIHEKFFIMGAQPYGVASRGEVVIQPQSCAVAHTACWVSRQLRECRAQRTTLCVNTPLVH
jgi:hypothetical protein